MALPAMGYGLRYEYGMFQQNIQNGWQTSNPITGWQGPVPGKSPGLNEAIEVQAQLFLRGARRRVASRSGPALQLNRCSL